PGGEDPEQRDDDGDDSGQHRAPDEEILDLRTVAAAFLVHRPPLDDGAGAGAGAAGVLAAVSPRATGRTGRPGPTFWIPSTMTRSPGFRPWLMIHTFPAQAPGFTSRAWTVSPGPTRKTYCRPSDVWTARTGTVSALSLAKPTRRARTNSPGVSRWSSFSKIARNSWVPVAS